MTAELAHFDTARSALALASSVDEIKDIRDKAEAMRAYAKQAGESLEMQNQCAEIKLRAERKAGEMLGEMDRRRPADGRPEKVLHDATLIEPPTLGDLGITRSQSSRWQQVASIPEPEFEKYVHRAVDARRELTTAGALKLAKKAKAAQVVAPPSTTPEANDTDIIDIYNTDKKFACIYADPAWQYGNQATRAATDNHYPTMPLDDICGLPVEGIAADNAHLHLWTTNAFLFDAKQVMEAWGFTYKSVMVWVKPQMGIGNYWRVSHEFLLLGTRGSCPYQDRSVMSWLEHERTRHSTKPEAFRTLIERVSPGPRLEMFARITCPGWSSWGNQVGRTLHDVA